MPERRKLVEAYKKRIRFSKAEGEVGLYKERQRHSEGNVPVAHA